MDLDNFTVSSSDKREFMDLDKKWTPFHRLSLS